MKHLIFTSLLLSLSLLGGCGQSGPLYVPEEETIDNNEAPPPPNGITSEVVVPAEQPAAAPAE